MLDYYDFEEKLQPGWNLISVADNSETIEINVWEWDGNKFEAVSEIKAGQIYWIYKEKQ
jgi:hypothetical protein